MSRLVLASLLLIGCGSPEPAAESGSELLGAPYKLFEDTRYPEWVMQDDAYVYYIAEATVMRSPKLGGAPQAIAVLPESPSAAALGGGFIYTVSWNGNLSRIAKSGGAVQPVAANLGDPRGLLADAQAAYVVVSPARILRVANGAATEIAHSTYVVSMALDDSYLYWSDEGAPNPAIGCGRNTGSVHKVAKLGGINLTLATGLNCLGHLELDASRAYVSSWNSTSDGQTRVYSVPKSGGLPWLQLPGGGGSFTVDASYLYWISQKRELSRTSRWFYQPQPIATGADFGPMTDAGHAYFWRNTSSSYQLYALSK